MSSINALCFIFLTSGLTVGFGHCIGMCGPIVVSLSIGRAERPLVLPLLFYNLGRVVTYTVMGGIMGATGSFTLVAAHIAGIQKGVLIFAGALILLMGGIMGGWIPAGRIFGTRGATGGIVSAGYRKLSAAESSGAYFPAGLLLGLLPCGPVYTALVAAAGFGVEAATAYQGVLGGMALMFCFGIGTIPALFIVGKLSNMGWIKSRDRIYRIGSVLMMGVGGYFVIKGLFY